MRNLTVVVCSVLFAGLAGSRSSVAEETPATPDALNADIEALKASKPAWREIAWKSCLLEGLKESRPILDVTRDITRIAGQTLEICIRVARIARVSSGSPPPGYCSYSLDVEVLRERSAQ